MSVDFKTVRAQVLSKKFKPEVEAFKSVLGKKIFKTTIKATFAIEGHMVESMKRLS